MGLESANIRRCREKQEQCPELGARLEGWRACSREWRPGPVIGRTAPVCANGSSSPGLTVAA